MIIISFILLLLFLIVQLHTYNSVESYISPNTIIRIKWKPVKDPENPERKVYYKVKLIQAQNTPVNKIENVCESMGGKSLTKHYYEFTNKNTFGKLKNFRYRPIIIEIYASYDGYNWNKAVSKYEHGLKVGSWRSSYYHPDSSIEGAYNPNLLKKAKEDVPKLITSWNSRFKRQPVAIPNAKSWCVTGFRNCVGINWRVDDKKTVGGRRIFDFKLASTGNEPLKAMDSDNVEWKYMEKIDKIYKIKKRSKKA